MNNQILNDINTVFSKMYLTKLNPNDLRVLVTNIGAEKDNVLLEFSVMEDITNSDDTILQIYLTLTGNYNEEKSLEIFSKLNELNQKSNLGSLGIYTKLKQIFYRYNLYIPKYDQNDIADVLENIIDVTANIIQFIDILYDYILIISDNPSEISLEDYLKSLNDNNNNNK